MQVGEIYKSNHWGDFKILVITDYKHVLVQFLNTANTRVFGCDAIKRGNICDVDAQIAGVKRLDYISPQREAALITPKTIYKSNFWGDAEVLSYISSTEIHVKFLESGNIIMVQRHALLKGLFKDVERQKQETRLRMQIDKEVINSRKLFQVHVRNLRILASDIVNFKVSVAKQKKQNLLAIYRKKFENKPKYIKELRKSKTTPQEQRRAYYEVNRERLLQNAKDWQRNNPEKARVRNRNRRARRLGAEGSSTIEEQTNLLLAQNNKCTACQCDLSDGKHLDHIMPLALGGSNWIENLQWLCPFCNISKNAKHPDIWAAEILSPWFQDRVNSRTIL